MIQLVESDQIKEKRQKTNVVQPHIFRKVVENGIRYVIVDGQRCQLIGEPEPTLTIITNIFNKEDGLMRCS